MDLWAGTGTRPTCVEDCANSPRDPQRRATEMWSDQRSRLLFLANLLPFPAFHFTRAETPSLACNLSRAWRTA